MRTFLNFNVNEALICVVSSQEKYGVLSKNVMSSLATRIRYKEISLCLNNGALEHRSAHAVSVSAFILSIGSGRIWGVITCNEIIVHVYNLIDTLTQKCNSESMCTSTHNFTYLRKSDLEQSKNKIG